MVFESLITPKIAKNKPWGAFFIGIFYSSLAILLSLWIFREYASLVMVFLTVMACFHFVYKSIRSEEKNDEQEIKEIILLKEHAKTLSVFVFLFLGFVFSYSVWFLFLPDHLVQVLFNTQMATISRINANVIGHAISPSLALTKILTNNFKVLFFCILFSFFYGLGAIFILAWNASVIGAAIGNFARNTIALYASEMGLNGIGNYFSSYSLSLLRYFLHGIPEIIAYFAGGLAGGIISIAVIRHEFKTKRFKNILVDSIDLVVLATIILIIAALLEVFVTPLFF